MQDDAELERYPLAGVFIGALLLDDPRSAEAFDLVEKARRGEILGCTSVSVLSEVYGALTWSGATVPLSATDACAAVKQLIEQPSLICVVGDDLQTAILSLELAEQHNQTGRRVHDARHAATAIIHGVTDVYTYDVHDWCDFIPNGIAIAGPESVRNHG